VSDPREETNAAWFIQPYNPVCVAVNKKLLSAIGLIENIVEVNKGRRFSRLSDRQVSKVVRSSIRSGNVVMVVMFETFCAG